MATYYEILGVRHDDPDFERSLKKAFRAKAKKVHPDRSEAPEPDARAKFQELNEAYAILSDPRKRAAYDRTLGNDFFKAQHGYKSKAQEFDEMFQTYLRPVEIFFAQEFKNHNGLRIFLNDQDKDCGSLSLVINYGFHNLFITRNMNDGFYHIGKSTQSILTSARQRPRAAFLLSESIIDVQKAMRDWVKEYATPSHTEIQLQNLLKGIFG